ncbi:MAG: DNA polymerase II [Pseudomonadales bacterium]
MANKDAFLLTRQARDNGARLELSFWFASTNGPSEVVISGEEAVFFLPSAQVKTAETCLRGMSGWRLQELDLMSLTGAPVSGCYSVSLRSFYRVRDTLREHGVTLFEADVSPVDRFLMERFLSGPVHIDDDAQLGASGNVRMTPGQHLPPLSMLSFDIETDPQASRLYSIAGYCANDAHVFMVGEDGQDERRVIENFLTWVAELDPDVLIGWNVVQFDLLVLQQCCDRLKLPFTLGRNKNPVIWRQSRQKAARTSALVPGRAVIDGIDTLRTAMYTFDSFSLETVAQILLGRGKAIENVDQRVSRIDRLFAEDKPALAAYNLEDCRLVWDIFQQEGLLDFAMQRASLTGLGLGRAGGSVAACDFLYLPRLHRKRRVAPNVEDVDAGVPSPGGYVLDSVPGIFHNVLVFDFKSLYPSIIRTFRIDPYGLHEAMLQAVSDTIPGFRGAEFLRDGHLLPGIIEELWARRDEAKANANGPLSHAIKIIMNSFYGVLGTPACRFYDERLASSITLRGHEIIRHSKTWFESGGLQVIYGDTDSLFIHLGEQPKEPPATMGVRLARELSEYWRNKLHTELALQSFLELQFETHFGRFFMPTVRGSEHGSKKRYAGLPVNSSSSADIVFKGLESARTDWTELAKSFQRQLLWLVFNDEPVEVYIRGVVDAVRRGQHDAQLVMRKRLRRALHHYQKNVPPHVQAARLAELERRQRGLPPLFNGGESVEYMLTIDGPQLTMYASAPLDYGAYIERQLAPVADAVLKLRDTSLDEIISGQASLF